MTVRTTNQEEETRKAACLEQLARDRQKLLVRWPFIGGVIMRMELVPVRDDRLKTAAADGDRIFVDIDFYRSLTQDERLFVLAHEVWHCVLLHFARKQNRDHRRFNIACDLEIHFTLAAEKMREPWVLPHDPAWAKLSAEEIYERLSGDSRYPGDCGRAPESADTARSDRSGSFDRHIYGGDRADGPPPENGGQGAKDRTGDAPDFVTDPDYAPCVSDQAAERVRGRVIASAQQLERTQGKLPAGVAALIERLQKPSLPWREMLRQFVTSCYGGKRRWLPPSRRHVWQGLYLPSMREERINAVVALDTSGSTENQLRTFFGELLSLMKSFGRFSLTVIQCDAKIQSVERFSEDRMPRVESFSAKGFGGTDFRPVFEYIDREKEKPDLLLYFTDGIGTAPTEPPAYPVMWVLTKDGRAPRVWGRCAFFRADENERS